MDYYVIKKIIPIFMALLLAAVSAPLLATTGYIADELYVPLRAGQGNQYKIHKVLRSSTKLNIISESEDGEWSQVEAGDLSGWMRSQYIVKEPTAELKLADVSRRLAERNDQYADAKTALQNEEAKNQELSTALQDTQQKLDATTQELEELKKISGDAVSLHQRHQDFMKKYELLQTELDVKVSENNRLRNDDRRSWFMYGAGAVGLGVLLTLIIPALRPKKKYSEWAN